MDFIVKLLRLRELVLKVDYNLILVIINKLTKYKIFKPYKKASIAKDCYNTRLRCFRPGERAAASC